MSTEYAKCPEAIIRRSCREEAMRKVLILSAATYLLAGVAVAQTTPTRPNPPTATMAPPNTTADQDRPAPQLGSPGDLDAGEEGVHVDVQHRATGVVAVGRPGDAR